MIKKKDLKAVREMLNEWHGHPLSELAIGVLVRHPLPWTAEKGYPGGHYVTASDGVEVAINVPEKTAYALILWAQAVVDAGERVAENSRKFEERQAIAQRWENERAEDR